MQNVFLRMIKYPFLLLLIILSNYSILKGEESLGSLDIFGIDWKLTIEALKKGIEKNPDDINLKFVLGNLYLKNNMLDEAESEFKKIIEIEKTHSLGYLYLGNIYFLKGANTKKAGEFYKKAIQYDKKNIKAYNLMNVILLMERNFKDAITMYEEAKKENPKEQSIFYNLALNYLSIEDTDNAIITAQKTVEIEPSSSNFFILGVAYFQKKEFNKAIEIFRKVLELKPGDKNTLIVLGQSYYDSNRYKEAVDTIREAIKLYPEDNQIKDELKKYEGKLEEIKP